MFYYWFQWQDGAALESITPDYLNPPYINEVTAYILTTCWKKVDYFIPEWLECMQY